MVALAVELTIDFLIFALLIGFPLLGLPLVIIGLAVFGVRRRIAPRLSTQSWSDRVAWAAFIAGVWTMLVTAAVAILGEGDGDFRTWDQIHRQVRVLWTGGIVGAGLPLLVTVWQRLRRVRASGKSKAPLTEREVAGDP